MHLRHVGCSLEQLTLAQQYMSDMEKDCALQFWTYLFPAALEAGSGIVWP